MLTLYEHPFALYCQKVLIALHEQGVEFDVRIEMRDFRRAELSQWWPPASIPVLRDGDRVIGETSIIIEHVAGAALVPSLQARLWDRLCDQYISDREAGHPRLTRYYSALAQRPSFAAVIEGARPYRELVPLPWPPDFDRYR